MSDGRNIARLIVLQNLEGNHIELGKPSHS